MVFETNNKRTATMDTIIYNNTCGSRVAVFTMFYGDSNVSELYRQHSKFIISSQESFAEYNNYDYYVLGNGVNEYYGITDHNLHIACLGMPKWYGSMYLFEKYDYDYVIFIDFDSIFLKNVKFSLTDTDLSLSKFTYMPYYDSLWFMYYSLYTGVSYEEFSRQPSHKFNSGIFKIKRGTMDKSAADKYVNFARSKVENEKVGWDVMINTNLDALHQRPDNYLTMFDETYLQHYIITHCPSWDLIDPVYNHADCETITPETVHLHFYADKKRLSDICDDGIHHSMNIAHD